MVDHLIHVNGCLRTSADFCRTFFLGADGTMAVDYEFVIGLYGSAGRQGG